VGRCRYELSCHCIYVCRRVLTTTTHPPVRCACATTVTQGGDDETADAQLSQADYTAALGSEVQDPAYVNFLTRISRGGTDQVLRYCRDKSVTAAAAAATAVLDAAHGSNEINNSSASASADGTSAARSSAGLLLLSSNAKLLQARAAQLRAQPCHRCGAPRTFECQVSRAT
jgi:hypothetical protein